MRTLVEIIEPYEGRVYDPACGSGGMFVLAERFAEVHGGSRRDISIFGQESNPTTWRLAHMKLAIRGIEFLSPLSELKCENNPALRDDPTVPVAAEDVKRLPINPSSKKFDRSAFVYDAEADCFHCPAGKTLSHAGKETRQTAAGPVLHESRFL